MNLKEKIEALDAKNFYSIGADNRSYIDLQADGEAESYLIEDVYTYELQDEFYDVDTPEFIKENNEWQYENQFIKQYFLDNINLIQTIKE